MSFSKRGRGLVLALLLLLMVRPAVSQEVKVDSSWHQPVQIGFAASSILKILEEEDPVHRYQLYGQYWYSRRLMIRSALRFRQAVGENSEFEVGLRGGLARVFQMDDRWRFYGGGDLITGYSHFANGNETYRVGVSPLIGILFLVDSHLSISIEPRLVATYAHTQNEAPQSNSDVFSVEMKGIGLVILSVHF